MGDKLTGAKLTALLKDNDLLASPITGGGSSIKEGDIVIFDPLAFEEMDYEGRAYWGAKLKLESGIEVTVGISTFCRVIDTDDGETVGLDNPIVTEAGGDTKQAIWNYLVGLCKKTGTCRLECTSLTEVKRADFSSAVKVRNFDVV